MVISCSWESVIVSGSAVLFRNKGVAMVVIGGVLQHFEREWRQMHVLVTVAVCSYTMRLLLV